MNTGSDEPFKIVHTETAAQFDAARLLFREYASTLETGICLADFEQELADLPQMYGPPGGALLLVHAPQATEPIGCAGVRRSDVGFAELKRVYVRPDARGLGLGRALTQAAIEAAVSLGYSRMVLDTLDEMITAQSLYRSLGFVERNREQRDGSAPRSAVSGPLVYERGLLR